MPIETECQRTVWMCSKLFLTHIQWYENKRACVKHRETQNEIVWERERARENERAWIGKIRCTENEPQSFMWLGETVSEMF